MRKPPNIGEKFWRLTVIGFSHFKQTPNGKNRPYFVFKCECGSSHTACLYDVRHGGIRSCGCLLNETITQTRHGAAVKHIFPPEYRAWRNMLTRARNPNIKAAKHYVLRGITVCDEWLPGGDGNGYLRFLEHVGPKPSPKHSLDRIDVNGSYVPGNVRWATSSEQIANRRRRAA
jgi:hypothetical protein